LVEPPTEEPVRRVQAALDRFGLGLQTVLLRQNVRTARGAARALGCGIDSIVKSLVLRGQRTGKAFLAEIGGAHRANLEVLARAIGEGVEMAPPDFVLAETGFPVGGVPPIGHRQPIATFVDETLLSQEEVWASAGSERAMFRLTPAQLIRITGGRPIRIDVE
jgi:prolyl-tRNA editing enzyme YbaK/EbsC (Cys-tRNA(Pro) deacylase)